MAAGARGVGIERFFFNQVQWIELGDEKYLRFISVSGLDICCIVMLLSEMQIQEEKINVKHFQR